MRLEEEATEEVAEENMKIFIECLDCGFNIDLDAYDFQDAIVCPRCKQKVRFGRIIKEEKGK